MKRCSTSEDLYRCFAEFSADRSEDETNEVLLDIGSSLLKNCGIFSQTIQRAKVIKRRWTSEDLYRSFVEFFGRPFQGKNQLSAAGYPEISTELLQNFRSDSSEDKTN